MAFKSMEEFNEERYSGMFMLRNDGDSAEVIFLYQNRKDPMMVDAHYIKSDSFSGYVQCLGQRVCPACERKIRVQPKLFIPVYKIDTDEVLFWDRSVRFFQQLDTDVFNNFGDPSGFVFKITRHGQANDFNTRYEITATAKNNLLKYEEILKKFNISFPEYYETICRDWDNEAYRNHLAPSSGPAVDVDSMPEYKISPRVSSTAPVDLPDLTSEVEENESNVLDDVDF